MRQFRKRRISVAGLSIVAGLFLLALTADFIANDKPLVLKYDGKFYLPVLTDYGVWLGIAQWEPQFQNIVFKEFVASNSAKVNWALFPPIRYSPSE